ncbi:uncharacterized protein [Mytilus edulis]|uniref:uncharacterized protein n=1 Tax=Mytilus edulis TaxID=6550 RepID=UPI0039EFD513
MDADDRRRYFIVGSVILEIVQPLLRTRLENDYSSKGIGSLQAFLSTLPVMHVLFHLRHRNAYCCKDKINCRNNSKLPLIYCQWDLLYTENTGQSGHNCHCKFIANPVKLKQLDITLASLILLNCCNLQQSEENAVRELRRYKNNYLSHNTEGQITDTEYKSLWTDLTKFVLQLDPHRQEDLIRIENRPFDEGLCSIYSLYLLNIHKKLDEIDTRIHGIESALQINTQGIKSALEEVLRIQRNEANRQFCKTKMIEQGMVEGQLSPFKLGQDINFYQHYQIDSKSVLNTLLQRATLLAVMMDDGRLVMYAIFYEGLAIYNTDGSQVETIPVDDDPCYMTAVNNSTVAVTIEQMFIHPRIDLYDINNKYKLKSIQLYEFEETCGITMINDKLIVGVDRGIVIIDYQTEQIVQHIEIHNQPSEINVSDNRIFYIDDMQKNLCWYSYTDEKIHTLTLPSIPFSMTTLQDGSLYVLCEDESVQHVSSDGEQFNSLKTNQSKFFDFPGCILYNSKQKKNGSI